MYNRSCDSREGAVEKKPSFQNSNQSLYQADQRDFESANDREDFRLEDVLDMDRQIKRLQMLFEYFDDWETGLISRELKASQALNGDSQMQDFAVRNQMLDEVESTIEAILFGIRDREAAVKRLTVEEAEDKRRVEKLLISLEDLYNNKSGMIEANELAMTEEHLNNRFTSLNLKEEQAQSNAMEQQQKRKEVVDSKNQMLEKKQELEAIQKQVTEKNGQLAEELDVADLHLKDLNRQTASDPNREISSIEFKAKLDERAASIASAEAKSLDTEKQLLTDIIAVRKLASIASQGINAQNAQQVPQKPAATGSAAIISTPNSSNKQQNTLPYYLGPNMSLESKSQRREGATSRDMQSLTQGQAQSIEGTLSNRQGSLTSRYLFRQTNNSNNQQQLQLNSSNQISFQQGGIGFNTRQSISNHGSDRSMQQSQSQSQLTEKRKEYPELLLPVTSSNNNTNGSLRDIVLPKKAIVSPVELSENSLRNTRNVAAELQGIDVSNGEARAASMHERILQQLRMNTSNGRTSSLQQQSHQQQQQQQQLEQFSQGNKFLNDGCQDGSLTIKEKLQKLVGEVNEGNRISNPGEYQQQAQMVRGGNNKKELANVREELSFQESIKENFSFQQSILDSQTQVGGIHKAKSGYNSNSSLQGSNFSIAGSKGVGQYSLAGIGSVGDNQSLNFQMYQQKGITNNNLNTIRTMATPLRYQ